MKKTFKNAIVNLISFLRSMGFSRKVSKGLWSFLPVIALLICFSCKNTHSHQTKIIKKVGSFPTMEIDYQRYIEDQATKK